jgi:hypothetical protein
VKNRNRNSTRYYSEKHENSVCEALDGTRQANSGAARFSVGDVRVKAGRYNLLIECKTCMEDKESFSIKKEWIDKMSVEARSAGYDLTSLCFNFGPSQSHSSNLYIINEEMMKFLVAKLDDEGQM